MPEFLQVLALAALPALGNFAGGLLAEAFNISERTLSLALHAAAGIILAVVGVELMPQALDAEPAWVVILAFILGGVFFILIDHTIGLVQARFGEGAGISAWPIYFGVAVDLFSDGLMIGASSTISFSLALLLALGQVSADIPEGFATIAAFKRQGLRRGLRMLIAALFAIPVLFGAALGYFLVRGAPEWIKLSLLAFTAGILITVVVEEIVPEAHRGEEARLAALVFVCGFALFTLLSVYLG
jgi:ZIP family zinc transporter